MNEDRIYPSIVIRSQAEAIELLKKENQQLKSQLEHYKDLYDLFSKRAEDRYDKIIELESKLQQRDEVIEEAIKRTNKIKNLGFDTIAKREILEILQKYKGDSNE